MQRQRRAAGAVIWAVASFAALQAGMALIGEFWLLQLRDPTYACKKACLQQRLRDAPGSPLVVMLGSSRASDILDGQIAEEALAGAGKRAIVFNFGIAGARPMEGYLTLRRLLADGVHPDVVLVEVMPPLLDERVGTQPLWIPSERLAARDLRYLQEADLPQAALADARRIDLMSCWYSRRFVILSRLMPRLVPMTLRQDWARGCDASGFVRHMEDGQTSAVREAGLRHARESYESLLQSFRLGGPNCAAVRQTLELCRATGIRAALVVTPEGSDFRSWYTPEARDQCRAFLRELEQEHRVAVINAREWLTDDDFYDSHHARNRGAAAFSRRLGRDCLPALLDPAAAR